MVDVSNLRVERLNNASFGALISGVDVARELDAPMIKAVQGAMDEHQLIIMRGQKLTAPDLVRFSKYFGTIQQSAHKYSHKDAPDAYVLSNIVDVNGQNIGLAEAGPFWHTDGVYFETPHAYTLFYAVEIPHDGDTPLGDTQFASPTNAYDGLSEAMKQRLAPLKAIHSMTRPRSAERLGTRKRAPLTAEQLAKHPDRAHPAIRTHPNTGRKSIYVNENYTETIAGMAPEEARPLLDQLQAHCLQPQYYYRHKWQVGDVVICDNCALQHKATLDYKLPQRRILYRTTIAGGVPF